MSTKLRTTPLTRRTVLNSSLEKKVRKRPLKKDIVEDTQQHVQVKPLDHTGGASAVNNLSQQHENLVKTLTSTIKSKAPAKVVAKAPKKKSASRSPVKKPVKKAPRKKALSKSPVKSKGSDKVAKKKTVHKVSKPKGKTRNRNTKSTNLDSTGIGIGPARVKSVLMNVSLNPLLCRARANIALLANRPKKPKPTAENPSPEMPAQGEQRPLTELDEQDQAVLKEAVETYETALRTGYEKQVIREMNNQDAYHQARQEEQKAAGDNFSLVEFNKKFNPKFYDKLNAYLQEHDHCMVGKPNKNTDSSSNDVKKIDEWSRATTLVNKMCVRLSGKTRYILACFLDCVVEQYAYNGILNCLRDGKHIVQLKHALVRDENFAHQVPLDKFVSTLACYNTALTWVENYDMHKQNVKAEKDKGYEVTEERFPPLPDPDYKYDFSSYVADICRSVRSRLAAAETDKERKENLLNSSVSRNFKRFCSYVVYETILRIGAFLRETVERANVKTISDSMVWYAIKQIHNITGIDFQTVHDTMTTRLEFFEKFKDERKEARKNNKNAVDTESKDDNVDDVEENEEAEEEEEEEVGSEEETEEVEVEVDGEELTYGQDDEDA